MIDVEKTERLKKILLTKYDSFDDETVKNIISISKDITVEDFYNFVQEFEYNNEISREDEEVLGNNILPIFSRLYSLKEIIDILKKTDDYSSIPTIIEYFQKNSLPVDEKPNYDEIVDEIIEKKRWSSIVYLYDEVIDELSFESKKKIFFAVKENIASLYLHQEKALADLLKTGCLIDEDISFLSQSIQDYPKALVELCLNKELEVLKKYLLIASDDEKNIIRGLITLNSTDVITDDLMGELFLNLSGYETGSAIASFAVNRGYIPGLEIFSSNRVYFSKDIHLLSDKNLIYYYIERRSGSISYGVEDKIIETIDTEEKKQAFNLIQELGKGSSFFYSLNDIDYLLEKVFKVENIPHYFSSTGCKKELLYEIFTVYNQYTENDNLPALVYEKCKEQLTDIEKKYYDLYTSIFSLNSGWLYNSARLDVLMNVISTPEELSKLTDEKVIELLNSTKTDKRIILGLLKIGMINENIQQEIFTPRERTVLSITKEYLDKSLSLEDIYNLYKDIWDNKTFINEDGKITNEYFEYCLSNDFPQYITSLSNKYITDDQRLFISLMVPTIASEYYNSSTEKLSFIKETFFSSELLTEYIKDGKATKALVDKLFEIGALNNIEKIDNYTELLSEKQKTILEVFNQIKEGEIQNAYCDFIKGSLSSIYDGKIGEEIVTKIPDLLNKINLSNSSEVAGRYISIAKLILQNTTETQVDPMLQFKKIEKIFLTRELSHMDKIFKSFQLLYPHDKLIAAIKERDDRVSPTLLAYAQAKEDTILGREAEKLYGDKTYAVEMIMYADLLKTTIASNDKTFIEYIDNIEKGNILFKSLMTKEKAITSLLPEEKYILNNYISHLENLYKKSHPGKKIKISKNLDEALVLLTNLYQGVNIDLIPDQIIKNKYQAYLGISTLEELRIVMHDAKIQADAKGREYATRPLVLESGDLIKGIGQITYLDTIIQNGSVSKEFLGGDVGSDYTPFDTDLSRVSEKKDTLEDSLSGLEANGFGPIFFVIKSPQSKFNCTRTTRDEEFKLEETSEEFKKIELFRTAGDTHYGIRTGFASTQVDYIYCQSGSPVLEQIGLILAKNGFYIPVIDQSMNLAFTPEDFDKLRKKMNGLSHYGINSYEFSSTISSPYTEGLVDDIIENIKITQRQKRELESKLREGFEQAGLEMKVAIDGDMSPGSVELIDTGSTSRGTNQIGDGDFDFTVRLDRVYKKQDSSPVKTSVCRALGIGETSSDVRKAKVQLSDKEVEVDISYASKSDRITYTTDMCITDRLETIKKQDPEKYVLVLANIILAKNILKTAQCYKPHHASENAQGGLGGVGTENWILQNGGSLEEAATEFLVAAGVLTTQTDEEGKTSIVIDENREKEHKDFATSYRVWDFGQNQLSEMRTRDFPYDNFVWNNMNPKGYSRMIQAMQAYMLELHPEIKFIPKEDKDEELKNVSEQTRTYLQSMVKQDITTENKGK